MRNSLILIGLTLRTFSAVVSDCFALVVASVHESVADQVAVEGRRARGDLEGRRSRSHRARPDQRTSSPSAVRSGNDGRPLLAGNGNAQLDARSRALPVELVNVTVVSCEEPGENVWRPGGVAVADAGARLSRATA